MDFETLLSGILYNPFWSVLVLFGVSLSLLNINRHPAATFSLIGFGLFFLRDLLTPFGRQYLMEQRALNDWTMEQYSAAISTMFSIAGVVSALGLGLLLASVFTNKSNSVKGHTSAVFLLLSFKGKVNRAQFLAVFIPLMLINGLLNVLIIHKAGHIVATQLFVVITFSVVCSYVAFANYVKRFRDIGFSAWASLTLFVPFINLLVLLFLIFARGKNTSSDLTEAV